ncbi:MAG: hypothetical protein V1773_12465 [bacterium]
MNLFLHAIFLFFVCGNIFPQTTRFDSLISSGINQIYSINFNDAEKTFLIVEKEYPNHPAGKFFDAMIIWWKIMLELDNKYYDDTLYLKLGEVIDFCDELLDKNSNNVDAVFFKGGALGFRGRLLAYRESWFKAAMDGKEALPLVKRTYELDHSNVDVQLGFGIYNYYIDIIPQKYPATKALLLFFPKGDKEKGLKQLNHVAASGKYTQIEAKYFLCGIYYQYEHNFDAALSIITELCFSFPNNPAFQKYRGRVLNAQKKYIESEKLYKDILNKCSLNYSGYNKNIKREANYYLGYINFTNKKYTEAIPYLEESKNLSLQMDKYKDTDLKINSILHLAMCYDTQNDTKKSALLYNLVLDMDDKNNSHKKAEKYLGTPFKP